MSDDALGRLNDELAHAIRDRHLPSFHAIRITFAFAEVQRELTSLRSTVAEYERLISEAELDEAAHGALLAEVQRRAFCLDLGDPGDETAADLYAYYQQTQERIRAQSRTERPAKKIQE